MTLKRMRGVDSIDAGVGVETRGKNYPKRKDGTRTILSFQGFPTRVD